MGREVPYDLHKQIMRQLKAVRQAHTSAMPDGRSIFAAISGEADCV